MPVYLCEWPKGCAAGVFAFVIENDDEEGYCGMHFLEWLRNLPWRDEVEDASFVVDDKHARAYRFQWTKAEDDDIERIVTRPRCPDCSGQYTPPMNPDHARYCTGKKAQ